MNTLDDKSINQSLLRNVDKDLVEYTSILIYKLDVELHNEIRDIKFKHMERKMCYIKDINDTYTKLNDAKNSAMEHGTKTAVVIGGSYEYCIDNKNDLQLWGKFNPTRYSVINFFIHKTKLEGFRIVTNMIILQSNEANISIILYPKE